jgi:hypothetical protein
MPGKLSAEHPSILWGLKHMRRPNNFPCQFSSRERGFANEARFLKFARPRGQDNVTNPVRSIPNSSVNGVLQELFQTTEITEVSGNAKGASA